MKIRTDFVTNSSSSSFICLVINYELEDKILEANGIENTWENIQQVYEEHNCEDILLKGNLTLAISDGSEVGYIGYNLSEELLDGKTLMQIKEEIVERFNTTYDFEITVADISLEYGEIYH